MNASLGYMWKKASEVVATSEGCGTTCVRSIRQWVLTFVRTRELPGHQHRKMRSMVLNNENIIHELKLALEKRAKTGFLSAAEVGEVVSSSDMQACFAEAGIYQPSISKSTAHCWLDKLGWRYGRQQNGMYVDGHECEDIVEYRLQFVERFKQHERRFLTWDNEGRELPCPSGFPVPGAIGRFRLVLITHNESVFLPK
jgi:hypothetical protein